MNVTKGLKNRVVWCAVLMASALAGRAEAQQPHWAANGCWYTWTGRGYATELCRRPVAAYTFDYYNPVRREWLLRIYDNPANLFQDITFLQGPMVGWSARLATSRPGENAVRVGIMAIRDPRGIWTNTPVQGGDTPAGAAARSLGNLINSTFNGRMNAITLGAQRVVW